MSFPVSSAEQTAENPTFFYQYDALAEDAANLQSAKASKVQAENAVKKVQNDLRKVSAEVKWNRNFYNEQVERIKLVSTHWLFGTTALQPQLWFRGGCKGKIQRAQAKQEKAEQDYPALLRMEQQLQKVHLPPLQSELQQHTAAYQRSVAATRKRQEMKQQAVAQHPSPKLYALQQRTQSLQQQSDSIQQQSQQVALAETCQNASARAFGSAESCLREAERLHERYIGLSKELRNLPALSSPLPCCSSSNNIQNHHNTTPRSHRRPCATPGCEYTISSWHETHCCNACMNQAPHKHGNHCERHSHQKQMQQQQEDEQAQREQRERHVQRERLQRKLDETNKQCHKKITEAQEYANDADYQLCQASTTLQMAVGSGGDSDGGSSSSDLLGGASSWRASSSPLILLTTGCACTDNDDSRANNIQQTLRTLHHYQRMNTEPLKKRIQDWQSKLDRDRTTIEQTLAALTMEMDNEKNHIFDQLCEQVMDNDSSSTTHHFQPSAPPGPL